MDDNTPSQITDYSETSVKLGITEESPSPNKSILSEASEIEVPKVEIDEKAKLPPMPKIIK